MNEMVNEFAAAVSESPTSGVRGFVSRYDAMTFAEVPDTASHRIAQMDVPGAAVVIGPNVIVEEFPITDGAADVGAPATYGCRAYPSDVENSDPEYAAIVRSSPDAPPGSPGRTISAIVPIAQK